MAKLSNITPGIAVVKERIKATDVARVGITALGLSCFDIKDEKLKSDIIMALEPAKSLFLQNPRAICEVSVIDTSFDSIYRLDKRFCITDALYLDPQQIAASCGLPYTPIQRLMLTPKMVLDIQNIMCGQSNTNICDYLKFTANALSTAGSPIYGLYINKVFIKDRRAVNITRVPDDQWSMSDTYKDIVWKALVNIAYNYIHKNKEANPDDICKLFLKTYGSSWISKLVTFQNKVASVSIPSFMASIATSNISSEQLVNAYQLMIAILKGKFCGVNKMDRDDTVEYIRNMQTEVKTKLYDDVDPFTSEPIKTGGNKKLKEIEGKLDDMSSKIDDIESKAKDAADKASEAKDEAGEAKDEADEAKDNVEKDKEKKDDSSKDKEEKSSEDKDGEDKESSEEDEEDNEEDSSDDESEEEEDSSDDESEEEEEEEEEEDHSIMSI